MSPIVKRHAFCPGGERGVTMRDKRDGRIDPAVEAVPAEGWRRWAADLGHYDKDRIAGFGGVIVAGGLLGIVFLYLFVVIADEVLGQETAALDTAAFELVHRFSSPQMDLAARAISFMGLS